MAPIGGFEALGAQIAQSQEAPASLDRGRAAIRARIVHAAFSKRRFRVTGFVAAAIVLATGGVVAWALLRDRGGVDIRFAVGNAPGKVGEFFSATGPKPLEIRFAEGTSALLAPGSKSRVASVSPFGADVVIEAGRAEMAVVPRARNRWSVHTGPFVIKVTGTRFTVAWDAAKDEFVLELFEGKVVLAGCLFDDGRPVVAGERVEAACNRGEYRISKISHANDEATRTSLPSSDQPLASADGLLREDAPGLLPVPKPASNWLRLAKAGRYPEAYRVAQADGFDAQCAGADAGDLLFLGDVARLSGHRDAARAAYHAVRTRFAGSASAAEAAFYLGRIDWDREADLSNAGKWLRTYLDEKPNGPLSAAALGRLLEIDIARGDRTAARTVAKDYLHRFPKGAHATAARRVLTRAVPNDG